MWGDNNHYLLEPCSQGVRIMSTSRSQDRENWGDKVFRGLPVGADEAGLFVRFLDAHDFAPNSRRAIAQDMRKFARWFTAANAEPFRVTRVTTRDVTDFKTHLRRDKGQAVATVNRALVTLRRYLGWLVDEGRVPTNPVKPVKELRKVALAPKGLDRSVVRRLLREIELRQDLRAGAVFSLFLYTGCRVSDLAGLELGDVLLGERSGSVVFRNGKGGKQRTVPLPLAARKALQAYLEVRPPIRSDHVFVGERGALTPRGVRALCDKYSAIIGVKIHPHVLRHTMAHKYLEDNPGDLVGLAQILGHESLNTTRRYVERTEEQLGDAAERLSY
jgi:integrase/recombinase XerC